MHKKIPVLYTSISLILISLVFTSLDGNAQSIKRQTISSYGSSAVISENVTISQTAGQSYNTIANHSNGTVAQGFQQPVSFSVEELKSNVETNLNITVYPNPASQSITLDSKDPIAQSMIQVTDINGRIFKTEKVSNLKQHTINCTTWVNGIYLITIRDASNNSKSIRLIISK
jgi:hypothetical protein